MDETCSGHAHEHQAVSRERTQTPQNDPQLRRGRRKEGSKHVEQVRANTTPKRKKSRRLPHSRCTEELISHDVLPCKQRHRA